MCTKSPSNPPPRDFHWIKLFSSWTGQKTRIQKSYNFAHLDPTFTGRDGIRSDCFRGGSKTAFQHLVGKGAVRSDDCSKVGPFFFPFLSAPFTMAVNFFVALQLPPVATSSHPARSSLCPAFKVQSRRLMCPQESWWSKVSTQASFQPPSPPLQSRRLCPQESWWSKVKLVSTSF